MTPAAYKSARKKRGTQAEVAASLGVARSTVAHRENGKMTITKEAALAILGVNLAKKQRANSNSVKKSHDSQP